MDLFPLLVYKYSTMNKLHIDIIGRPGHPLVLLHGWGWHSRVWAPLLPQLQQHFQLFLIDLPGAGLSEPLTGDYTFATIAPMLLEKIPERAAWLGWSLGGLFAMDLAIRFPERVSHLITIASTPRFTRDLDWPGIERQTLEKFSTLLIQDQQKTLHDFLELQLRGSPNRDALFAELKEITATNSLPTLLSGLQLLCETDFRADLKKITCPSLHIFGQRDTIVPMQTTHELAALLPQSQVEIIKHTGHMPFLTHPDPVLSFLRGFIKKLI